MEKEKLLQEIIYLAMAVQTETKHCVFVRYSGHVDSLEIEIRESKKDFQGYIADCAFYANRDNSLERMKEVKETLLGFLEAGEVDTSEMDYTVETIYHPKF